MGEKYRNSRISVETCKGTAAILMDIAISSARRGETVLFFTGAETQQWQTAIWDDLAEFVGLSNDQQVTFDRPGCRMWWPSDGRIIFGRRNHMNYRGVRAGVVIEFSDRCPTNEAAFAHTRITG